MAAQSLLQAPKNTRVLPPAIFCGSRGNCTLIFGMLEWTDVMCHSFQWCLFCSSGQAASRCELTLTDELHVPFAESCSHAFGWDPILSF